MLPSDAENTPSARLCSAVRVVLPGDSVEELEHGLGAEPGDFSPGPSARTKHLLQDYCVCVTVTSFIGMA